MNPIHLTLPDSMIEALPVIQHLQNKGFEAVFVGGAVRDTVLGLPVNDVDIATSALPEQVMDLFPHHIATGLKHGTITVIHHNIPYEVTTYRQESAYEGYRRPEAVQYITELDGDLLRRDFTMNAMALTAEGELYDPYGGMRDLEQSIIRCVGESDARFQEDALRMLRAIRFIAVYNLKPVKSSWKALKSHQALMVHIAMERVLSELDKLIESSRPMRGLFWLAASGLHQHIKSPLPFAEQLTKTLETSYLFEELAHRLARIHELGSIDERWAYLWISLRIDQEEARGAMNALRFSNSRKMFIMNVLRIHHDMTTALCLENSELRMHWLRIVIRYGEDCVSAWLRAAYALSAALEQFPQKTLNMLDQIMQEMPVKTIKGLRINGRDLQEHLHRKSGPWVSEVLENLLLRASAGQIMNDKGKLLEQAELWNNDEVQNDE